MGLIATLLIFFIMYAKNKEKPAAMPPAWVVVVSIVLVLPMAFDGASSYLGLYETNNLIRYLTGYLCGTGIAVLTSGGLFSLWRQAQYTKSTIDTPARLWTVLVASAAAGAAFYLLYPYGGIAAPLLAFVCQWLAFAFINVLIVSSTHLWLRSASQATAFTVEREPIRSHAKEKEAEQTVLSSESEEMEPDCGAARVWQDSTATMPASLIQNRVIVIVLCFVAALVELAALSLIASVLGALFPWVKHP